MQRCSKRVECLARSGAFWGGRSDLSYRRLFRGRGRERLSKEGRCMLSLNTNHLWGGRLGEGDRLGWNSPTPQW